MPLVMDRRVAIPLVAGPGPTFAISKLNSSGLFAGGSLRAPDLNQRPKGTTAVSRG